MIRQWKVFWFTFWSVLIGAVLARNIYKYKDQPVLWNIGKSLLDTAFIMLSALFLPPLLVGVDVAFIVSKLKRRWEKISVGILAGIGLGILSTFAIEPLIILGIFSVDIKTGPETGMISRWRQAGEPNAEYKMAA